MIFMASEEYLMKLYEEIIKVRQLLELLAKSSLKDELEKVATTDERRKVWALCNGFLSTKEIAEKVDISTRAVQIFLKELRDADLITMERRGYPKRRFDYIPSSWKVDIE